MKTAIQITFDEIVNEIFSKILKPLGYRKKNNNFYLQLPELGKIINLQKSQYSSKNEISFTINVGIFSPEFWKVSYNFFNKPVPGYPTEPECIIRQRIGKLLNSNDTWYDIKSDTDIDVLKTELMYHLLYVMLPFLGKINSNDDLLHALGRSANYPADALTKIILLCELKRFDEARIECDALLNNISGKQVKLYADRHAISRITEIKQKYSI